MNRIYFALFSLFISSSFVRSADSDIQVEEFQSKIFHINPWYLELSPVFDNQANVIGTIKKIVFFSNSGEAINTKEQNIYHVDPLEGFKEIFIDAASTALFIELRNLALTQKTYIKFDTGFTTLQNDRRWISQADFENAFSIVHDKKLPRSQYSEYFVGDFLPSFCDQTICFFLCCFSCEPERPLIVFHGNEIRNHENNSWWTFFKSLERYSRSQKVLVRDLFIHYPQMIRTVDAAHIFIIPSATEMTPLM